MEQAVSKWVDIQTLKPHPKNPRMNDEAVPGVQKSIERFGFTNPIIANADSTILCGHTRWKASKELGLTEVPVVYVDLTDSEAEMLMIADNKLGEHASWDYEQLHSLLQNLYKDEQDLDVLGFGQHELDGFLFDLKEENNALTEWVDMPEFEEEDKTSFRRIIVHFEDQAAVDEFAKVLQQSLTSKTRSIWYPEQQNKDTEGYRY